MSETEEKTTTTTKEQTEKVISNGNGGLMVLAFNGDPHQIATKFFHDAVKYKRQNNSVIYKAIQKSILTTDDQAS